MIHLKRPGSGRIPIVPVCDVARDVGFTVTTDLDRATCPDCIRLSPTGGLPTALLARARAYAADPHEKREGEAREARLAVLRVSWAILAVAVVVAGWWYIVLGVWLLEWIGTRILRQHLWDARSE